MTIFMMLGTAFFGTCLGSESYFPSDQDQDDEVVALVAADPFNQVSDDDFFERNDSASSQGSRNAVLARVAALRDDCTPPDQNLANPEVSREFDSTFNPNPSKKQKQARTYAVVSRRLNVDFIESEDDNKD